MNLIPKLFWTFVFTSFLVIYSACRKTDQSPEQKAEQTKNSIIEERFFNSNRTTDPNEKALVEFLRRKNDKERFVEITVAKIGYPRWDKIVTTASKSKIAGRGASDSSLSTFYLPFVRDSQNYVNASMVIKTYPSDTSFSYKCDWQYTERQNNLTSYTDSAEYYAIFFMVLNKAVFGHTQFTITDTSLFKHNSHKPVKIQLDSVYISGRTSFMEPIEICQETTIWYQNCPWNNTTCTGPGGTCDNCWQCTDYISWTYCWTEWIETGGGGGGGGTGGSGGSGGTGGSGGGSTPLDCEGPTAPFAGKTYLVDPCSGGWEPIPIEDEPPVPTITYLTNTLGLSSSQISFLIQNPTYQEPLYSYISQNYSSQSVQLCKDHIDLLISEPMYIVFVNNHNSTGNHSVIWWIDDNWLDNPQYFNLDPGDEYKKLTAAEKTLVKQHPTAAFIINQFNKPMATNFTVQKFGTNGLNDKSDAFRHAFFLSLNTLRVGANLSQQFSDAHETEISNQLIKEKQMDLFNNSIGITYGQTQSYPTSTPTMIAEAIYLKVLNGELRYLKPIDLTDPNFWGTGGISNPNTATHGISASTTLVPTNQ